MEELWRSLGDLCIIIRYSGRHTQGDLSYYGGMEGDHRSSMGLLVSVGSISVGRDGMILTMDSM